MNKRIPVHVHIIEIILIFQLGNGVLVMWEFLGMVGELPIHHHVILLMEQYQMATQFTLDALEEKLLLDLQDQHVKMAHGVIGLSHVKVRKLAYYCNVFTMDQYG